jgi:hypothetical protein
MNVVSSHRPHSESGEYASNQIFAKQSWDRYFREIIYYGPREPDLASDKTTFIDSEPFPTIKSLSECCSWQEDWCAIINADIFIGPNFCEVESELKARNAKCAISLRQEFVPGYPPSSGHRVDLGLDFFAATPKMWRFIAQEMPSQFRIGHQFWDTWMLAFMSRYGGRDCYDATPQRFVFHPRHGDRRFTYKIDTKGDQYTNRLTWPSGRLRCCLKS